MLRRLLLSVFVAAAAALSLSAASPKDKIVIPDYPIRVMGGPGIAISGSGTAEQLPAAAQKFIKTYYGADSLTYCHLDFLKGSSDVRLSDGTQISFDRNGKVTDLVQADNRSINTDALSEILPANVFKHLIEIGDVQNVSQIKNAEGTGTCVMLINTTPSQLIFDYNGNFLITAG